MRIGTTSYIYAADILTNVSRLCSRVDDIELVLFELNGDFPDPGSLKELAELGRAHDTTYTVHLPLDLTPADPIWDVEKTTAILNEISILNPYAYILHPDGAAVSRGDFTEAAQNYVRAVTEIRSVVQDPRRICVENLENHPPEMIDAILLESPVSCCIDVGHLWKQGLDPLPHMDRWLHRARVVHLHGVGEKKDHKGLSVMDAERVRPVIQELAARFDGVLTMEVFSEVDLDDCINCFNTYGT